MDLKQYQEAQKSAHNAFTFWWQCQNGREPERYSLDLTIEQWEAKFRAWVELGQPVGRA